MWVQTFGLVKPHIQEAVKDANTMFPNSPARPADQKVIGVLNRKFKSSVDLILRRKHPALDTNFDYPGTIRCSPLPAQVIKRIVGKQYERFGLICQEMILSLLLLTVKCIQPLRQTASKVYLPYKRLCVTSRIKT